MSTVLIVGGGQAGLHLGNALLVTGHEVTLLTDRDAEQLRTGAVRSTHFTAPLALERQRADGLPGAGLAAPPITRLRISVAGPHAPALTCAGALPAAGCSLDYRVSHPAWMQLFVRRGGRLEVRARGWSIGDVDAIAGRYDVVVVATGRGGHPDAAGSSVGGVFASWSTPFVRAQRRLSAVYVRGLPEPDDPAEASLTICPGLGEVVRLPGRTLDGTCDVVLVEALPGGPWDRFTATASSATAQLEAMTAVLEEATGRIGAYRGVELTDGRARLVGEVMPRVSAPVGWLPSGRPVLALGDAAVTMDPLAGQGGNQATLAASIYAEEIDQHDGPFDERWMRAVSARYWRSHGAAAVGLSTALISSPLPATVTTVLGMASRDHRVADAVATGFGNPSAATWIYDERAFAWRRIAATCGPMVP